MADTTIPQDSNQDYKLIALTGKKGKGLFVKVSPERYEYLSQFTWRWVKNGYAKREVLMHCEIMGYPRRSQACAYRQVAGSDFL